MQSKKNHSIFASTKCYKCIWCKNAFDAKMHLMRTFCFALQNAFVTFCYTKCTHQMHFGINKMLQMHFGVHFPKENVQLCKNAFDAYILCNKMLQMHFGTHHIFQRKMFSTNKMLLCFALLCFALLCFALLCFAKIHFCIKYIFASNTCLQSTKCIFASNTFWHQIHFCIKYIFASNTFCIKYIFASNTFLHQIHFCIKYIFASNTFLHQIHFCIKYIFAKHLCFLLCFVFLLFAEHFAPLWCWTFCSFVMLNIFQRKMFSKTKCYKCIFAQLNIFQRKMWCKNVFDAKMYLMQKCIWCKNVFDAKMYLMQKCIWCKNVFDAKMYLMQKCIWCKNVFDAKMYLMQKCIWCKNVFDAKMYLMQSKVNFAKQSKAKQSKASHFVVAKHFPLENVQQSKMLQMHFCTKNTKHSSIKCIFAKRSKSLDLNIFMNKDVSLSFCKTKT